MWQPTIDPNAKPKYKAIADAIESAINSGELSKDQRLPTHRALADQLNVTVGTITRAYGEAERRRLVQATVGSGTYVLELKDTPDLQIDDSYDPNVIDMSLSLCPDLGQNSLLGQKMQAICQDPSLWSQLLDYHPEAGLMRHRQAATKWLALDGVLPAPDNILICGGGQHAIFSVMHSLCQSGDVIISDQLTYTGVIMAARQLHLKHLGVASDHEGMIASEFELTCQRHRPRMLYLTPNLNNPTCAVMSEKRKVEILDICKKYGVYVLEDGVQSCLLSDKRTTLQSLSPQQVIYITSCSKAISPGIRVGYIVAPDSLINRIGFALRTSNWMTPPVMVEMISRWLLSDELAIWQSHLKEFINKRQKKVAKALSHLNVQHHLDGLHCWLPLAEPWRASSVVELLKQKNIIVKPAEVFAVGQANIPQGIRFCIGKPLTEVQLEQGLAEIAQALSKGPKYEDLIDNFTV